MNNNDETDNNSKNNSENNNFNNDPKHNDYYNDFFNNVSEELKAEMFLLRNYYQAGKSIGSFYSGMLEEVGIDLATEFTKIFIGYYVNNLFSGQKG